MKPQTLAELEKVYKELEEEAANFKDLWVDSPVRDLRRKLLQDYKVQLDSYADKKEAVYTAIRDKKIQLKAKRDGKYPPELLKWFKRKYTSGVDFGYGGISLRYMDSENRFIIVTANGGTAGTGTPMGTGGYYYAESDHFVAYPKYGSYINGTFQGDISRGNSFFKINGGMLTKERMQDLISKAIVFYNENNLEPFKLDEL